MNMPRAIKEQALVSPDSIHILNENTKIAIRMTAGVERIVPPDFVGLALSMGALPGVMYKESYGQYRNLAGELVGDAPTAPAVVDPAVVVMEDKPNVTELNAREPMEDTTPSVTEEALAKAIFTIQQKVAADPTMQQRLLAADGRPKVPALEQLLGCDITAAQRDAAWEKIMNVEHVDASE